MTREEAIEVLKNTEDNINYDKRRDEIYFTHEWVGAYEMAIAALREQDSLAKKTSDKKTSEWISVEERLPELHQPVLVYSKRFDYPGGDIAPDERVPLYGDVEVWVSEYKTWKGKVTHWMPLPEPPEVEG